MMNKKLFAALHEREIKEEQEIQHTTVSITRHVLVQALNMAADVMGNSAAVAKSNAWQGYYRELMNDYRTAANNIALGAKLSIKG